MVPENVLVFFRHVGRREREAAAVGSEENVDAVFADEPLDRPAASVGLPLVILDDE
jgi:hypothetical protein